MRAVERGDPSVALHLPVQTDANRAPRYTTPVPKLERAETDLLIERSDLASGDGDDRFVPHVRVNKGETIPEHLAKLPRQKIERAGTPRRPAPDRKR